MNGLYGLTLPLGSVPIDGVQRLSSTFDRIGLMARHPRDLEELAKVLLQDCGALKPPVGMPEEQLVEDGWQGLRVGILDCEWGIPTSARWKWSTDEVVSYQLVEWESLGRHH